MNKHASLNKLFRLVWSVKHQAWVAVAEHVSARGKSAGGRRQRAALAAAMAAAGFLAGGAALAAPPPGELPTGGNVVAGSASIGSAGNTMNINQATQRAVIDWNTFNVGSAAQVNFNQPSASSATLNRVLDNNASHIAGRITANGQVVISNPNGVLFTHSARVDVGGLTATTHRIGTADFMAGLSTYHRDGATGAVVNQGQLSAALGGYIALLAPEVRNEGIIVAQAGTVALAAGELIRLDFDASNTLAGITATPSQIAALVENKHAVYAPGGLIVLSARAIASLHNGIVRNSGTLSATSLSAQGGRIVLGGDEVQLTASSHVEARGATAGGRIDIAAGTLDLAGHLDAGGASGGQVHIETTGASRIAATLAAQGATGAGGSIRIEQSAPPTASAPALAFTPEARLDASGATDGGDIAVHAAGDLTATGASLVADGDTGNGGAIALASQTRIALADTVLRADGGQDGGAIGLASPAHPLNDPLAPPDTPPNVALTGSTGLSSAGRRGRGGRISLSGRDLLIDDDTTLVATGASGGGTILVGGEWQGGGTLPQATTLHLGANARIDASATENGDGGTVVLWSDVHDDASITTVRGSLLARGGEQGGDGGRIETSGHVIDIDGARVNAGADFGNGGLWLIDPYNYTINQSAANNIAGSLNTGTSVTVTTSANVTTHGGSGSGTGNIDVNSTINKTGGGAATLSLIADGAITVAEGVSFTDAGPEGTGALSLKLQAAGPVRFLDNSTVTTSVDIRGALYVGGKAGGTSYATGNSSYKDGIHIGQNTRLSASSMTLYGKGADGADGADGAAATAGGNGVALADGARLIAIGEEVAITGIGGKGGTGTTGSSGGSWSNRDGGEGGPGSSGESGGSGIVLTGNVAFSANDVALTGTGGAGGTGGKGGKGGAGQGGDSKSGGRGGSGGTGGAGGEGLLLNSNANLALGTAGVMVSTTGGAGGAGGAVVRQEAPAVAAVCSAAVVMEPKAVQAGKAEPEAEERHLVRARAGSPSPG